MVSPGVAAPLQQRGVSGPQPSPRSPQDDTLEPGWAQDEGEVRNLNHLAPERPGRQPPLRIRLIGGFAVEQRGRELSPAEVGSRKARTALKVLAAHRGRIVPIDSLVETLWGDRPPADAPANVATLVSRLRATFGAGVIEGTRAGYRLATGRSVVVDLDEAGGLVAEAEARLASGQPALAVVAAEAALSALGPGTVLDDEPDADRAGEAAREAERLLRRGRAALWRAASALGDHRRALAVAADAVAADPLDEEAHRSVMRAYHRLGEPGEALAAYERLRTVLVEELGADPGAETERLYLAVLQGQPVEDEEARAAPPLAPAVSAALVGRDQELEALIEIWASTVRGSTGCVVLSGEAGIGKTALAGELAQQAESAGGLVLEARCYEAERSLFLQPVLEAVRAAAARVHPERLRDAAGEWAGALGALVPELTRVLPPVAYQPASAELERRRAFEAVRLPRRRGPPDTASRRRGRPPPGRGLDRRAAPLPPAT
jgi:DNA-binding SARP family transcriptional activator